MHRERVAVVVYGATGFTGRLILAELRRQGLSFAVAGRPSAALNELGAQYHVPVLAAALTDPGRVAVALSRGVVTLACAGPYAETGLPLLHAALKAGTHLLDLSGEPEHLRAVAAHDAEVKARGLAVVHSVGFDVVPSELLAHLCHKPLGPLSSMLLATAHTPGVPSHGTLLSYVSMLASGPPRGLSWADGGLRDEALGAHRQIVPFPAPLGDRAAASVASAEVVLLARSIPTQRLTHLVGTVAPAALPIAEQTLPMASREGLERSLAHLASTSRAGPEESARATSQFALWCRAETAAGAVRTMTMNGPDPYGLSAVTAVACAKAASHAHFSARGVLTPLQAFEPQPLLAAMAHAHVRWRPVDG
ncbi:MAG: saccharopine dehydrogenase NADP-binding domain-containing protein [Archangium sp.]|nr:saccharopine dehydrogenase NADP-binding domain-containing protein [Archangium sp.]